MLNGVKDFFSYWYLQYELITCIYMFEPWEKLLLHGAMVCIFSLMTYSSYTYLPKYLLSLWASYEQFIS